MCNNYNPYLAGPYEEEPKKKRKKKRKGSKRNSIAGRAVNLLVGVVGGAVGHFVVPKVVEKVVEDKEKARTIKNITNTVLGTGTALVFHNATIQSFGAGLAGDGMIDGGLQIYEKMGNKVPVKTNYTSDASDNPELNGYEADRDYYEEDINGYDDYEEEEDNINGYYDEDYEDGEEIGSVIDSDDKPIAVYGASSNSRIPSY